MNPKALCNPPQETPVALTNLTQTQMKALDLLRRRILLERASLHFTDEQLKAMTERFNSGPGDRTFCDDTPEIREAMRLYVATWVLPIIDALMAAEPQEYDRDLGCTPTAYLKQVVRND